MIDFGKWAFANRKLVYFVVAVLLVGGILSAYDMSKLEDPEIKVKLAMVIATRPGASAHEMELEVTDPLEKNIRTMGEVESVTSSSFNDLAILEVELKSTVRDADVEQCWDMLRRKASDVQRRLPSGTSVVVQDDFGLVYGMLYALTGDGLTERQLSDYAGLLKRELGDLDGVARVEIYGEREECIDISILPEKMAMLGVSPAEALATLNGQNNVYYAGYYDNGPDRIRVAVADKFRAVKEIESMVIQGHEDDQLRLCDIARVEHGYAEPVRNEMSYEGQRALGIAVAAASGKKLVLHEPSYKRLMEYFARGGLSENQVKQAMLPEGCTVLQNDNGTAPGCAFQTAAGKIVLMLPGPPSELEPMLRNYAVPYLAQFQSAVIASHSVHVYGRGEAAVAEMIADLTENSNPTAAPYAKEGEMFVRVTAKAATQAEADALCAPVVEEIRRRVGSFVYGVDVDSLEALVVEKLRAAGKTLATAESCTGGLLAKRITDIAGSSDVFEMGCVTYANRVKENLLGVPHETLEAHGAVSEETARAMAEGIVRASGADATWRKPLASASCLYRAKSSGAA